MLNDPLFWILVLPGLLLGLYAQGRIKFNFAKYSQVGTQGGITGAEVARRLLDSQGLQDVAIEIHSRDPKRSLRSSFQDFAAKPRRLLFTECRGCWRCGS